MNARFLVFLLFTACGSRTALDLPDATPTKDAAPIPPPFDAGVPPIDGSVAVVDREGCADAGVVSGLVVATDNVLLRFDPVTGFHPLGVLSCNNPTGLSPESMAVARDGTAYVYFAANGVSSAPTIYHVDPNTLECSPTPYVGADGERVGMGFTTDEQGPAETLYLLTLAKQFFKLDTTFDKSLIVDEDFSGELAGGGDGRLFSVYFSHIDDPGTRLVELDKTTGAIIASDSLYDLQVGQNLAVFRLGTAFYIFTQGGDGTTTVSSYDLPTKTLTLRLFTWSGEIVGAGASTCASW